MIIILNIFTDISCTTDLPKKMKRTNQTMKKLHGGEPIAKKKSLGKSVINIGIAIAVTNAAAFHIYF